MSSSSTRFLARIALVVFVGLGIAACDSPEERLQNHYETGQELLEEGDAKRAALEFRNALQINSDHVPSIYGLSEALERQGNYRGVAKLLRKILDLQPDHLQANIRFGRIMLLAGQLDKALEYSDKALEIAPDSADALSFRAGVLLNLEDTQGAVEAARKAREIDPSNVEALSVLAARRIAEGDVESAIDLLDEGLKHKEKNVTLQLIKLGALAQLEDTERIEGLLDRLIEFYPDTRAFKEAKVRFLVQQERHDEAESLLRTIAEDNPDDVDAHLDVVRFLNEYRSADAAQAELEELAAGGGDTAIDYRMALAQFHLGRENVDQAKAVLREAVNTAESDEARFRAKNQLANILRRAGDRAGARELVNEVLEADSQNGPALITRARLRLAENQVDDAIIDLRTVLKDDPDSVQALILLGTAHNRAGQTKLAEEHYTRAFQASNGSADVGVPLANFLLSQGDAERAENVLVQVLERDEDNVRALRALGQARISRQDWVGAQEVVQTLKQLQDNEAVVGQIEGFALQGQNRMQESVEAFERAQSAAPNAMRPMVSLVNAYLRNNEPARAEKFLTSVLESSENNLLAQVLLAQLYANTDRPEKAEAMFETAIEANPEDSFGYTSYSAYLIQRDRREEAMAVVSKGLERMPGDATLGLIKGQLLQEDQDFNAVLSHFQEMYEANDQSPLLVNNFASMLTELDDSRETAERALEIAQVLKNTEVPQFKDTLGWIYYRLGRYEEAVGLLREAADGLPNLAVVHAHLGLTYKALNQPDQARKSLERALELADGQGGLPNRAEVERALAELGAGAAGQTDGQSDG